MGWQLKIFKDKYSIWSTVVDEYIVKNLSKNEIIKFLFWDKFEKLINELVLEMVDFPSGWTLKNGERVPFNDVDDNTSLGLISDREKKFDFFLDNIAKSGISFNISDIDGVNIYTPKPTYNKICTCGEKAIIKGLCKKCYQRKYYVSKFGEKKEKPLFCKCGEKHFTKGLCKKCYMKIYNKNLTKNKIIKIKPIVEKQIIEKGLCNCGQPIIARKLCKSCYDLKYYS